MSEELRKLAPPKRNETFRNTAKRRRTVTTGHAERPIKGLVQFNTKVRQRVRDRFEALFAANSPGMTKGEFLEAIIMAYEEAGQLQVPAHTESALPSPDPADRRDGRTRSVVLYATPEMIDALDRRAQRFAWTFRATVEHACATAQDVLAEEEAAA